LTAETADFRPVLSQGGFLHMAFSDILLLIRRAPALPTHAGT
jgi:hypothetical protein